MAAKSVQHLATLVDRRLRWSGAQSPGKRLLSQLFEVIFFATLKTEEGKPLQFRIIWVDPKNPDTDKPPHPRADRWSINELIDRLPLTVATLIKLSRAADPWNSSLAVYYRGQRDLFVWGLVDQTVHFNTMLVRENTEGAYAPPGLFQVLASGPADLSVHSGFHFIGRLVQDTILKSQTDVFWSGPVSDCIDAGIQPYLAAVWRRVSITSTRDHKDWNSQLADRWISTLCRILISIQRYRHGGALLITRRRSWLNIKYAINYRRLPIALRKLGITNITHSVVQNKISTDYIDDLSIDTMPTLLYLDEIIAKSEEDDYKNEITGAVRFISSLSCVDGVILATPELSIRGFGVEILAKKDPPVVYLSDHPSARKTSCRLVNPQDYGTRHRSMMRYCFVYPGTLGFVVSQDGEIRVMTRVRNPLVMWENLQVLDYLNIEVKQPITKDSKKTNRADSVISQ